MRKKAEGLTLNVVVVAALALLVLVILTVIVIQRTSKVQQGFACDTVPGAQCMQQCGGAFPVRATQYDCPADGGGSPQVCCLSQSQGANDDGPGTPFS